MQIGITSYGSAVGCGIAPDYFTRVSSRAVVDRVRDRRQLPPPPVFVPPFNAPAAPAATLAADGVSATFAAPAADPATLPTAFAASLVAANGTRGLDADAGADGDDGERSRACSPAPTP